MVPAPLREVLRSAFTELAASLQATSKAICEQHIRDIRKHLPPAAGLSDDAALDDLPEILETFSKAFLHEDSLSTIVMLGPPHAAARFGHGFKVEEVVCEYALLRLSMRPQLAAHLGRALRPEEEAALHAGMDCLLATTLKSFAAQREDRLRLETNALGHFLSSLAHDLRNEINGVTMTMELLEETGRDLKQTLAAVGHEGIRQMEELLNDVGTCRGTMESTIAAMTRLLEAERVRNQVALHLRDTAMFQLLQGIVRSVARVDRSVRGENAARRIQIRCAEDMIVWTDPDLLGTVLVNLIGNAVKYAPDGLINFTADLLPDGRCQLEVQDHGPGIPPDRLEKLFEKFVRATGSEIAGLGLGLFIARRAADLLGGKLSVQSTLGQGSRFTLELPARPPRAFR
jgi:signal transduction histidine kinase